MRVYILGPMRGIPLYNFPAFDIAADQLRLLGHVPVSPTDLDRAVGFNPYALPESWDWTTIPQPLTLKGIVAQDIAALLSCQGYLRLPNWEASIGARAEYGVAVWLGLKEVQL